MTRYLPKKGRANVNSQPGKALQQARQHRRDAPGMERLAEIIQPDETRYSREQAKRAAESAFSSGQVEALAKSQIQQWIHLGY
jgi:hypothetical protein